MCNSAEMRQFKITYRLKERISASVQNNGDIEGIGKQSVCNNAEMRQFRITYRLKEPNSASVQNNGDIEGVGNNQCVTMLR